MGLITFEGKPIEKLIEVISQGIGTLYKPRAIKKEADAEAYKIAVIEKAKANAVAECKIIELETYDNIENRIIYQETRKQRNIDSIIEVAAEQISQNSEINSENVDIDWSTRFFNIAEEISNDEMQKLWGRILAGEVKTPGSFSLRTLDLLKNLNKQEAEIFTKFVQLNLKHKAGHFIPYVEKGYFQKQFDIPYSHILTMIELGLLSSGNSLGLTFPAAEETTKILYENGEMGLFVETSPHLNSHTIHILSLTKIGLELSTLISFESSSEFLNYACRALSTPYTKIKIGKIDKIDGDNIQLVNVYDYKS